MMTNELTKFGLHGLACMVVVSLAVSSAFAQSKEVVQSFPANEPKFASRTEWRVVWDFERHGGASETLVVKEAYFKRSPKDPEIKVLDDTRLAEIFVPYNNGVRIYDISGHRFELATFDRGLLGPACVAPGILYNRHGEPAEQGVVAVEVHDGHLLWMNSWQAGRRRQSLDLWSVLDASNYRYIIMYQFRDDGSIGLRLGATAHNLYASDDDWTTHLHVSCWRINVELGDANDTTVALVRQKTNNGATTSTPLTKESRLPWIPEEFTRLNVHRRSATNGHIPPNAIGYDLVPKQYGLARFTGIGEEFSLHDFWVTNREHGEIRLPLLNQYENQQSLEGKAKTIWHNAALLHVARDEDFGTDGTNPSAGVAITTWAGCDLMPRNLFASTPLYP